jgi:putative oxidoreductase
MSSLFVFSGLEKITDYNGAVGFAAFHGVPAAWLLMPAAIAVELGAAAAVIAGWHTRIAAAALIPWTLILGVWFHQFWSSPPPMWQVSIDDFFHHFVMAGGFVCLAVCGPGRMSMDARDASGMKRL